MSSSTANVFAALIGNVHLWLTLTGVQRTSLHGLHSGDREQAKQTRQHRRVEQNIQEGYSRTLDHHRCCHYYHLRTMYLDDDSFSVSGHNGTWSQAKVEPLGLQIEGWFGSVEKCMRAQLLVNCTRGTLWSNSDLRVSQNVTWDQVSAFPELIASMGGAVNAIFHYSWEHTHAEAWQKHTRKQKPNASGIVEQCASLAAILIKEAEHKS